MPCFNVYQGKHKLLITRMCFTGRSFRLIKGKWVSSKVCITCTRLSVKGWIMSGLFMNTVTVVWVLHWWGESPNVPIIFQSAQTNVQEHDVFNAGRCFLLYEETLEESWHDKSYTWKYVNLVIIILYLDRDMCFWRQAYGGTIYLQLSVIFFSPS